ncbi:8-oxoguanine deaminase [Clostridium tunisiense]|uniref:8-oxoguanine deaminase n=1 Tax=Clostridium tunisiense TaxID=219748 RepID=UPI0002E33ADA|nr:8-oxoguanine deaminase [Clostridium tunisiense]
MSSILFKNIGYIITMNDNNDILEGVDLLIKDNKIIAMGKNLCPFEDSEIIPCDNLVVMPGFVNTHHHLYQTLFRGIQEVQDMPLFPWLIGLYEFWKHITPEAVYYGAMVGFSELLRTGCTTTMDHHYLFPKFTSGELIDDQIKAASEIGIRFHATRGSMSLGKSGGGLPPDCVVQKEEDILVDSERLINKYHDSKDFAMTRIALAPCSPFSVSTRLMTDTKDLARKRGVMMHTHLCETIDEENFCIERYGRRPVELMEDLEWIGSDVWFAHGIYLNDREIKAINGAGIAHCPSSNMKLGSGICRTSELIEAKVPLGIAVDGSASNDGSNMWEEVRRAYLLNHLKYGDKGLTAYETLRMATRGGAEVLGRTDTGYLEINKAADIIVLDLSDIAFAGCHDPLVSIVCCGNTSFVKHTIVNGKILVRDGVVCTIDIDKTKDIAHGIAKNIVEKERNLKLK